MIQVIYFDPKIAVILNDDSSQKADDLSRQSI